MSRLRIAALLLIAMPLTACASSHLIVEQPNRSATHANAVTLQYDEATTGVPQDASDYVKRKMEESFFGGDRPRFNHGQELTVKYGFVGYDEGSRLGRWAAGSFGVGEAQMVLEAQFLDASGTVLARVRGEGEVRAGFLGGSSKTGIDKAVKEIAQYAVTHFHR